jgi:hypothetical protein
LTTFIDNWHIGAVAEHLEATKAAAPYWHPRLQAVEHAGLDLETTPHKIEIEFV